MAEYMTFVKSENARKAEEAIRKDFDLAAKQSLTIRDAKVLNIKQNGSFFFISGSDEGVKKCKELIKEFEEKVPDKDLKKAKEEMDKEADAAASGMGNIFG